MNRQTNRRTFVALSTIGALGLVSAGTAAQDAATPSASDIPDSPAGQQLAWILDVANGVTPVPGAAEIEERFSAEFIEAAAPDELILMFEQIRAQFAPVEVTQVLDARSPYGIVVVVSTSAGMNLEVTVYVEETEPHRIAGLWFAPHAGTTTLAGWDELDAALATETGSFGVHAAGVDAGQLTAIHQTGADLPLAVGSAFKLYVLGALVEEIEAGRIAWDDKITVVEEMLSLPSGITQDEPIGSALTVEELALRMISISDNTATDLILHAVGREKVERALITLGNSVPERNRPFLTTREMFIIKVGDEAGRAEFAAADESRRRAILAEIAGQPLPVEADLLEWTSPRNLDTIEWFATMEDLSRAMVWLGDAWDRPGLEPLKTILTSNPGMTIDATLFPTVAFKGGSEPGVLTLAWLLERNDGQRFTLCVTVNDPESLIDETTVAVTASQAMGLLAD